MDSQQAVEQVQQPAEHPETAIEEAPAEPETVQNPNESLDPQINKDDDWIDMYLFEFPN